MPNAVAYLNGEFIPASQLALSVHDTGFVQGVAIGEQIRTFGGKLFRLPEHITRLGRSLEMIGLAESVSAAEIGAVAEEIVERNYQDVEAGSDLGLSLFVTPGAYPTFSPDGDARPTVGLHTYSLPFHQWCGKYAAGDRLVVSQVRQVPSVCWPAALKCRSRMHYYLADREAAQREPGARALLLDLDDHVVEASTANLVAYFSEEGLVSPPLETILPGVSVAVVAELAQQFGVPFSYRYLKVADLLAADELLLSSTSPCVWSVVSLDGHPIGDGRPGPLATKLLSGWSDLVGLDIRAQAERFGVKAP